MDQPSTGAVVVDGGLRLAYREWPGQGAPIALLHGLLLAVGKLVEATT